MVEVGSHTNTVDIEVEAASGVEAATGVEAVPGVEAVAGIELAPGVETAAGIEAVAGIQAAAGIQAVVSEAGPKEQHNCCREPVLDFQNRSQKNKDTPVLLKQVPDASLG